MQHPLDQLRLRIQSLNDPETPFGNLQRVGLVHIEGFCHVEYYGYSQGEGYHDFCETVNLPEVRGRLLSIRIHGQDEGANGTRNWDLSPFAQGKQSYSHLQTFSVALNQPADHNRTIIGADYEEGGITASIVAKCPRLQYLIIPSAPSPDFFEIALPELRLLSVDAGYNPQDFLKHFAASPGFSNLHTFEWGEYSETYIEGWETQCAPYEDYASLLQSPAFASVARFVLRHPHLSREEIDALLKLRPDLQFLLVQFAQEYASSS